MGLSLEEKRKCNREYQREYRKKHPEYNKRWRLENPDRWREYREKYRRKHPEKARRWARKYVHKRILELFHTKGGKCELCGYSNPKALIFHHVNGTKDYVYDYLKKGFDLSKIQLLCQNCHHVIHNPWKR